MALGRCLARYERWPRNVPLSARRAARRQTPVKAPRHRLSATRQRQRLIDACISALHIYGPSRTTVAKVVAIAKLSPGIVRFYFKSKGAMLVASLRFLATEFEQQVLEPVGKLRHSPVQALQKMVELYLDPAVASPRKVSVWYAFWGEATARQEYLEICGQKDERFADMVLDLIGRMIEESRRPHLDPDAIALGLSGVLEMLWQSFAFQAEEDIDRAAARRRCMAYLSSVFPGHFPAHGAAPGWDSLPPAVRFAEERARCFERAWQFAGHELEMPAHGDYLALTLATSRALVVRDGGQLRAFRNTCPRQPHALVMARRGHLHGAISCPLHRLSFAFNGGALAAAENAALIAMDTTTVAGLVLVSPGAASAAPAFTADIRGSRAGGGIASDGAYAEFEVAADWKTAVEQLLLHRLPEYEASDGVLNFRNPVMVVDAVHHQISWRATPNGGDSWSAQRLATLAHGRPAASWARRYLWPNLLLEFRPDGLSAIQVMPFAAGRSLWQCFDYRYQSTEPADRASVFLTARAARQALRFDIELASSTQQGMTAPGYAADRQPPTARAVAVFRQFLAAQFEATV